MKRIALALISTMLLAASAQAGCVIEVDRTPCPGEEMKKEAFKPYDGKNPTKDTDEKGKIKDEKACMAAITKNCTIVRRDVLQKKVVWGSWNGKSLAGKEYCESTDKLKAESNSDCKK